MKKWRGVKGGKGHPESVLIAGRLKRAAQKGCGQILGLTVENHRGKDGDAKKQKEDSFGANCQFPKIM